MCEFQLFSVLIFKKGIAIFLFFLIKNWKVEAKKMFIQVVW